MKTQIQSTAQSQPIKQLCLSGILDSRCHIELQKQLDDWQVQANDRISLNLENVIQINSSGIGVLILLLKELKAKNISFKLCNPSPSVYLTLKMSGMLRYFKIDEPDPYLRTARGL
jgi:anti-anti-sigma factor